MHMFLLPSATGDCSSSQSIPAFNVIIMIACWQLIPAFNVVIMIANTLDDSKDATVMMIVVILSITVVAVLT